MRFYVVAWRVVIGATIDVLAANNTQTPDGKWCYSEVAPSVLVSERHVSVWKRFVSYSKHYDLFCRSFR